MDLVRWASLCTLVARDPQPSRRAFDSIRMAQGGVHLARKLPAMREVARCKAQWFLASGTASGAGLYCIYMYLCISCVKLLHIIIYKPALYTSNNIYKIYKHFFLKIMHILYGQALETAANVVRSFGQVHGSLSGR